MKRAQEKEEVERRMKEHYAAMEAMKAEGQGPKAKLQRRMTREEKEISSALKKHAKKLERERWPKVAGYGHISPHCGRLLPFQLQVCQFYNTGFITWGVAFVIIGNF